MSRWPTTVLLVVATMLGALPAAAQDEQASEVSPDVRLVVSQIDGLVGPGVGRAGADGAPADLRLRVLVENEGDVDVSDLQVVVQVQESVEGARSVLAQALDEQVVQGDLEAIERHDVRDGGDLRRGEIAGEVVTVDGGDIGWSGTNDVYPVQVSVLYGAEVLDQVVTAAVHLADAPEHPLQTTVVWPLSAPTTRTARGRYVDALPRDLEPGGRIDQLLSAAEASSQHNITLAPETDLVEELADRADGFTLVDGQTVATDDPPAVQAQSLLQRLRDLVQATPLPPVVGPYGRADVAPLASAPGSIAELAPAAIETARTRSQALLGRAPDPGTYLSTTPLTPASLGLTEGGTHLLLPAAQVQGGISLAEDLDVGHARHIVPEEPTTPQRLTTVADPRVATVVADPPVEAGLVIARQRLVAETALLHLTRPSEAGRSLLVLPPILWEPPRGSARAMLAALVESPWIELTGPNEADPGPTSRVALATAAAALPGVITAELTATREQLDALRTAMPDGLPDLDGQTVADLEDALLRALTPDALQNGGSEALASIRAVREVSEDAFGEVALTEDARVALTSDTGEVPVTLQRTDGGDIELLVEVDSGAGLLWDDEGKSQRVLLPEGSSRTVAFSARAAARGTFAVTVTVWDPTHHKLLDTATLSVRSTSISRPALAVIGGVVLVLLAIGARRRRSPSLEVVR